MNRLECFCCSCHTDRSGYVHADPHCRYHGFDGKRPCETHGMPGYKTELTNTPRMPESVEKKRLADASWEGES